MIYHYVLSSIPIYFVFQDAACAYDAWPDISDSGALFFGRPEFFPAPTLPRARVCARAHRVRARALVRTRPGLRRLAKSLTFWRPIFSPWLIFKEKKPSKKIALDSANRIVCSQLNRN